MNTIQSTATFPLPPRVRSAFYALESADTISFVCELHSECAHLLQELLDSGRISSGEYVFYVRQAAARLESFDLTLGGAV